MGPVFVIYIFERRCCCFFVCLCFCEALTLGVNGCGVCCVGVYKLCAGHLLGDFSAVGRGFDWVLLAAIALAAAVSIRPCNWCTW